VNKSYTNFAFSVSSGSKQVLGAAKTS